MEMNEETSDYDRPLDVVWLCNKHHGECHKIAKTY